MNAVYNLFNYSEGLQSPELMIRRLADVKAAQSLVLRTLRELLLGGKSSKVRLSQSGILIDGPWGDDMPLRDLADGYKSAFIWIADFMGWALGRTPALGKTEEIKGIVLTRHRGYGAAKSSAGAKSDVERGPRKTKDTTEWLYYLDKQGNEVPIDPQTRKILPV
ncbi:MAG: hypothetical protein IH905_13520 [Proteobacteria bacterium]|nr:hypothetical protein [Pseudomonadota bacterium]